MKIDPAIVAHVLSKGLGMIPDPEEPYFSIDAIASVIGREPQTVQKKLSRKRIRRHPVGAYFRLSEALAVMAKAK